MSPKDTRLLISFGSATDTTNWLCGYAFSFEISLSCPHCNNNNHNQVASNIVQPVKVRGRVKVIERFIRIAKVLQLCTLLLGITYNLPQHLRALNNFHTLFGALAGLQLSAQYLPQTFLEVSLPSQSVTLTSPELEYLCSPIDLRRTGQIGAPKGRRCHELQRNVSCLRR